MFYLVFADTGVAEGMKPVGWGFVFTCLVIFPIILMNILIAIVIAAFSEVMGNPVSSANYIVVDLILDLEVILFWNRKRRYDGYVVFAEEQEPPSDNSLEKELMNMLEKSDINR